ncbi:MAG: phosphomannomutase, partial [Halieaceae bacterium]
LLIAGLMSRTGQSLGELVSAREAAFPCSGEINREVADPAALLQAVEARYAADALAVEKLDGLGLDFADWRFNLRMSNTEPVVRLNVESRGNHDLMSEKTAELLAMIDG